MSTASADPYQVHEVHPADALERALLNHYQRDFPLTLRPFATIAAEQDTDEETVLAAYRSLVERGAISRLGAVVRPHRLGASTLAALAVPTERLEEVAEIVNSFPAVNHNYEREDALNMWFVATAPSAAALAEALADISDATGLTVYDFPLEEAFLLDLGFSLKW